MNHSVSVCPSVYLFLCLNLCPARNFVLVLYWQTILANGSVTISQCVAYIYGPDTTLIFDLKVNTIYRVLDLASCSGHSFLFFDIIVTSYLTYECITIRECVRYIHDLSVTLTFDVYMGGRCIICEFCLKNIFLVSFYRS